MFSNYEIYVPSEVLIQCWELRASLNNYPYSQLPTPPVHMTYTRNILYVYTHTLSHMHIHTHTHTHTLSLSLSFSHTHMYTRTHTNTIYTKKEQREAVSLQCRLDDKNYVYEAFEMVVEGIS